MGFPRTSRLDDFQRPDAANLGSNYTVATGYNAMPIYSHTAGLDVSPGFEMWSHAHFRPNQEVWGVVADELSTLSYGIWLAFRCPTPEALSGYRCIIQQEGGGVIAHLYDLATNTEIGTQVDLGIAILSVGDLVGVQVQGYWFTLYYRPAGGTVVAKGMWYDTTYAPAWSRIGVGARTSILGPWYAGPWPAPYHAVLPIPATSVSAAYQPKEAAGSLYARTVSDYAASLVDIARPGIHDAVAISVPLWAAATGWRGVVFPGGSYLTTGIIPTSQDQAIFGSYSGFNVGVAPQSVFGGSGTAATGATLAVDRVACANYSTTSSVLVGVPANGGVVGVTGTEFYYNGILAGMLDMPPLGASGDAIALMASNAGGLYSFGFINTYGECFVIYNKAISGAQAVALSWAMEVIRSA